MPFNHAKSVPLSFQKCMTQPNLIDLDPNEYIEALNDNPFAVNIDRCVRCCNTLSNLLKRVCVPNKTEDSNRSICNMTTGINESKALTKPFSFKRKCKFDRTKCNSNQKWNNDKCLCKCKNRKTLCASKKLYLES